MEKAGRQALFVKCDVASEDAVEALAADVEKKFGRCDILINNAGIFKLQLFEDMTLRRLAAHAVDQSRLRRS